MAVIIEITEKLYAEISEKFKKESIKVMHNIKSLEESPNKGKVVGNVGGMLIKEIKYKSFRFYYIVDGYVLKCFNSQDLVEILLRFVRMSDKKFQQKTIDKIKSILQKIGPKGLN